MTAEMISPLAVDQDQYERIKSSEAVAVSMYRGNSGLFSKLGHVGTVDECESYVKIPALFIVPSNVEYLGSEVVLTKDLLPPDVEATP